MGDKVVEISKKRASEVRKKNPGEIGASTFIMLLLIVGLLVIMVATAFQRLQPASERMANLTGVKGILRLAQTVAAKDTSGIVPRIDVPEAQIQINIVAQALNNAAQAYNYDVCAAIVNQLGQIIVAADNIPGRDCEALILALFTHPATQLRALSMVETSSLNASEDFKAMTLAIPTAETAIAAAGTILFTSGQVGTIGRPPVQQTFNS